MFSIAHEATKLETETLTELFVRLDEKFESFPEGAFTIRENNVPVLLVYIVHSLEDGSVSYYLDKCD